MNDCEKNLLGACLKGERPAWNDFVQRYSKLVYHTIKNTLHRYGHRSHANVVEDLHQEFFLSLLRDDFKKLRQFRGNKGCTLASWLRIVASRLTIDFLRRQSPSADGALNPLLLYQADYPETLIEQEKQRLLSKALESLPPRDRFLVELHFQQTPPAPRGRLKAPNLPGIYLCSEEPCSRKVTTIIKKIGGPVRTSDLLRQLR